MKKINLRIDIIHIIKYLNFLHNKISKNIYNNCFESISINEIYHSYFRELGLLKMIHILNSFNPTLSDISSRRILNQVQIINIIINIIYYPPNYEIIT